MHMQINTCCMQRDCSSSECLQGSGEADSSFSVRDVTLEQHTTSHVVNQLRLTIAYDTHQSWEYENQPTSWHHRHSCCVSALDSV